MSLDWDELFDEEVHQAAAPNPNDIEDAERCRTQSSSESEDTDVLSGWWAVLLRKVTTDIGLTWPRKCSSPVKLLSACSGCSAESAVCKAK